MATNSERVKGLLLLFEYKNLSPQRQVLFALFNTVAHHVAERAPDSDQTLVCLRKLLDARDAAERAAL